MKTKNKKICIIKLDGIGDVLRTTPILWSFQNDEVTWITGKTSVTLLNNNPFIKTVMSIVEISGIENFVFDELYNFDEDKSACLLATSIKAAKKKGYGFREGCYYPFDSDSNYAFQLSKDNDLKFRLNKKTYQQIIFEMAGLQWKGEDYVLGYKPKGGVQYEVGINYLTGDKFPNKAWPHWKEMSGWLDSVSLQRGFNSIEEYIDWINSCRIIVTGDSLGMHVALALRKKVVILMGSTSWNEIETYDRGIVLTAPLPCSPCYKKSKCTVTPSCMELITPEMVYSRILELKKAERENVCA
jgi:heptosyltransferase-2